MYCRSCGKEIAESAKFCKYCGAPTGVQTEEASPKAEAEVQNAEAVEAKEPESAEALSESAGAQSEPAEIRPEQAETQGAADPEPQAENAASAEGGASAEDSYRPPVAEPKKSFLNKKTIVGGVVILAIAILLINAFAGSGEKRAISALKGCVFDTYTTEEFGTAVKRNMNNPKYEAKKVKSSIEDYYEVSVTGLLPDLGSRVTMVFNVYMDSGSAYAIPDHVYINGEYASDFFSVGIVMGVLLG